MTSADDGIDRGISEFGATLAVYVQARAGCRGAVLTDDDGYPIDYARRRDAISILDVQLLGAQLERAIAPIREVVRVRGLGRPILTVASERGILLTTPLTGDTTLAALHGPDLDDDALTALEVDFTALAGRVQDLLEG